MRCLLVGLVLISIAVAASGDWITVTVDPGADDQASCFSLSDVIDTNRSSALCSSLMRAVGDNDSCTGEGLQDLDSVVIRLADGNHTLTGEGVRFPCV